jgi:hypothetical protein
MYEPFNKPNNTPQYVHIQSNHPPNILKNLPSNVNKRLSEISSDEAAFKRAAPLYQEALNKSGYKHLLKFTPNPPNKGKSRSRKIVWFNPPFDLTVKSNIGKEFLKIVKLSFPIQHPLHKILNTNTLKLSYSCMPHIKNTIDGHNKKVLQNLTP